MSVFDLDTRGQNALAEAARLNPIRPGDVEPGFFTGIGAGIGKMTMRGFAGLGRTAALAGSVVPMAIDAFGDDEAAQDWYFKNVVDDVFNKATDYWTPGANEVGTAGRVLGGLAEFIPALLIGGGNPLATTASLTSSQTAGTGLDLVRQGVDGGTAGAVAAIQGVSAYVGFRLPFLGKTLATRMASGAGGNLAINAGTSAAQEQTLLAGGYEEQAKAFDPANLEARAVDVLTGLAFGGVAHLTAPKGGTGRDMTAGEVDATLAAANAQHFQEGSAPGIPADPVASAAHQRALEQAIEQLTRGERVDVAGTVADASFVPRQREAVSTPELDALRLEAETQTAIRPAETAQLTDAATVPAEAAGLDPALAQTLDPDALALRESPLGQLPEFDAARQAIEQMPDLQIATGAFDADGNPITRSARETLLELDAEARQAEADSRAFDAAVTCFLRTVE